MRNIKMLDKFDTLQKGDWCRPLYMCTMSGGHSDYYSFKSVYGGTPENNSKWCRVELIMPFWIGGTINKFEEATDREYEFIRGDLAYSHIHESAEAPEYDQNLKDGVYDPHE